MPDKLIAAIVGICTLVFVIAVLIYLGMDKKVEKAKFCLKKMDGGLNSWIDAVGAMIKETGSPDYEQRFSDYKEDILAIRKYNELLKRTAYINGMFSLACDAVADYALNEKVQDLRGNVQLISFNLEPLITEYNKCAAELFKKKQQKIPALIARVFRIQNVDSMRNLEV